jgi:5'-methylthioadenosine phosphorylase
MQTMLGVIGGSGVYAVPGVEGGSWVAVDTPWGRPSDDLFIGRLSGLPVAFLPRHGRGHVHTPTTVPYRANIAALKMAGVTDVIAVSACGSLREEMRPGDIVMVDQFIDRTFARDPSFFGPGLVAHVGFADPTCPRLSALAADAAGDRVHRGGTYVAMEGPQFSTRAESRLHRSWGADVVGMTACPEAKLAREAELCYALAAMVTDYDAWKDGEAVDVAQVVATLAANVARGQALVAGLAAALPRDRTPCPHGCDRALDGAIMTAPVARDPAMAARLAAVAPRAVDTRVETE